MTDTGSTSRVLTAVQQRVSADSAAASCSQASETGRLKCIRAPPSRRMSWPQAPLVSVRLLHTVSVSAPSTTPTVMYVPSNHRLGGLGITFGGWAIDGTADENTGVDYIDSTAQPSDTHGIALGGSAESQPGRANTGERADIAAAYGPQFRYSGYGLTTVLPGSGT